MPFPVSVREPVALAGYLLKWMALTIPLGVLTGSSCALFLWSLDLATDVRTENPWFLFLLPVAGAMVGWMYLKFGKSVEAGNNLIIDEIHEPGGGVPLKMAPLVLIATVITHLFGGSAGREGTAVQMGGSLASGLVRIFPGLSRRDIQTMLMAGIAAGFAGVFGTPVAGMIFAMEVLSIGRMHYGAIVPCLIAAIVSDQCCTAWGIRHSHYQVATMIPPMSEMHLAPIDARLIACTVLGGMIFGLTSVLFSRMAHRMAELFKRLIRRPILRPVIGGLMVIGLVHLIGTTDFLGLGVTSADPAAVTIVSSFHAGGAHAWSWWWKIVFTVVTIGSGFKGGEVTPLFFIGAALGNALAVLLGTPVDLFAALGFISVFAGATNTPLACTMMAVELFGGEYVVYFAMSSMVAYLFSGHSGIYLSQRIGTQKPGSSQPPFNP